MNVSSTVVEQSREKPPHLTLPHRGRALVVGLVATLAVALRGALLVPLVIQTNVVADTRLVVGDQTLGAQMVPGYTLATVTLAETYARFITKDSVKNPELGSLIDLQATVIPDNPVLRIQATAKKAKDALSGVAAAARMLTKSVSQVSGGTVAASEREFVAKRTEYATAQSAADVIQAEISRTPSPTSQVKTEYQTALTAAALAQLESDASGRILQNQMEAAANRSTGLTVIMEPQVSSNDTQPRHDINRRRTTGGTER